MWITYIEILHFMKVWNYFDTMPRQDISNSEKWQVSKQNFVNV